MKSVVCVILICISALFAKAQSTFARYYDESSIPVYSLEAHLDIPFQWNMKGKMQVHLNEGLNYLDEGNIELSISNFNEALKID